MGVPLLSFGHDYTLDERIEKLQERLRHLPEFGEEEMRYGPRDDEEFQHDRLYPVAERAEIEVPKEPERRSNEYVGTMVYMVGRTVTTQSSDGFGMIDVDPVPVLIYSRDREIIEGQEYARELEFVLLEDVRAYTPLERRPDAQPYHSTTQDRANAPA